MRGARRTHAGEAPDVAGALDERTSQRVEGEARRWEPYDRRLLPSAHGEVRGSQLTMSADQRDPMRVRVFQYIPDLDAFDVTPEYRELADLLGLTEWSPVVWIGRLFTMDNDFGEHWFDNWDLREAGEDRARAHGRSSETLFYLDPQRFQDGRDGPCNTPEIRRRFWRDVLTSLELGADFLFDKARAEQAALKAQIETGDAGLRNLLVDDLEARIARWRSRMESG
jgi:hypothetical protein